MLDQPQEEENEQSFLEHLEELRWHVIRSAIAIVVITVGVFLAKGFVFDDIILKPSENDFWTYKMLCKLSDVTCIKDLPFKVQSRKLQGQFTMHIMASLVLGFVAAFPYVFWEIWRFIKPGLHSVEQKAARGATFFVSVLFLSGVAFGYFIIFPLSLNFLSNYQVSTAVVNEFDITSYVSTMTMLILACGMMFQLPVVVYFLSKAELITPELMRAYRRHAIVAILFISALLTPPDVISQFLISLPLFSLYEASINISAYVWRKKRKELKKMGLLVEDDHS